MRLLTLDMQLLTLVPNHLSTVKNYQSTTSITHPYSLLFTSFHPSNLKTTTPHQSGEEKRGVGEKTRVAARGKRSGNEDAEEEKVGKSVVERCISTPIPNHLSTLTFTSNA